MSEEDEEDGEVWTCGGCGVKATFGNPWSAARLNLETDTYYIPCPFCDGELHYEETT